MKEFYEIKQRKRMVKEFFIEFNIIRMRAGLTKTKYDIFIIERLKKAINIEVVQGVLRSAILPISYAG